MISPENWGQWERHLQRNSSLHIYTKNKQRNNSKQYNTDLLCLLQGGSSSPKNTGFVRLRTTTTIFQQSQSRKTIDTWTLVDRKYHEIDQAVPPLGCEGVTQDRHCTVGEPVPGICRPVS